MYQPISYYGDPYSLYPNLRQFFQVIGKIREKWEKKRNILGEPLSNEMSLPSAGRWQLFQGGRIYFVFGFPEAYEVHGLILAKYERLGFENGFLGYPITDETATPDGSGRFNHFQGGSIYYHPNTGDAFEVHGAIREKYASLGWERSFLGYPTSDEQDSPDERFNTFQGGEIRWNKRTGVARAIRYY